MDANFFGARIRVRGSLWAAGLFCLAVLLIYHDTAFSMVYIWSRSDTFAHGFLIVPISLWVIWTQRDLLVGVDPRPVWWIALLLIPVEFGWLLARLVDVAVIQQLALVATLVIGSLAILGFRLGSVLAFPLFFLFFAVPVGEGLVAPMMEFTATSTVWLIEQTGIPVYREGLYFNLPTGNWSVVEACSGVRYIIASVTVGVLYAYLTYRSWTRRALFVLVSIIVPIFANTVRAYMIVMLGHLSGMTIATGADHLVYGWVFFGVVIFLLFWLGGFFREDLEPAPKPSFTFDHRPAGTNGTLLATFFISVLLAAVAPVLARELFGADTAGARHSVSLPAAREPWRIDAASDWSWKLNSRVSGQSLAYYQRGDHTVRAIVQFADGTIEGADVIGSSTMFTRDESAWRVVSQQKLTIQGPDGDVAVDAARVRGAQREFLVWSWYRVGGASTSNNYEAKLRQTLARLGLADGGTYRVIVATPVSSEPTSASALLQDFVREYGQQIYQNLEQDAPAAH